jgi:hypothetical protein
MVVMPARVARSAIVSTSRARNPQGVFSGMSAKGPMAPWLLGCRPVNSVATEGSVHGA